MQVILRLSPKNASAMNFIGYAYAERGVKLVEAERLIRRALELRPDDGYITDSLGWVLFKQGRLAVLAQAVQRAICRDHRAESQGPAAPGGPLDLAGGAIPALEDNTSVAASLTAGYHARTCSPSSTPRLRAWPTR